MTQDRQPRIFYGWFIIAAAFCIQMVTWGIFSSFGVFFTPLLEEFGWTRATLSGAHSLAFVVMGFSSIIIGKLGDKFGPRIVMMGCGFFFGLGYILTSQTQDVWQLYVSYGVIAGVGVSGADVLLLPMVARWFIAKRGMMSGIIKVGTGVGMLVMPMLATWLIYSYGWRNSYIILATTSLALIILATLFLKRDPAQKGLIPYGGEQADINGLNTDDGGFSLQEAIRTRQFWMVCVMYLLILFCAQAVIVHIAPHTLEWGISATNAASILATIGGVSIVGRFAIGSAGDRVGHKFSNIICCIVLTIALFWLQLADELWKFYLFAVIYGFAHGGFFALISPLIAELFGLGSHGVIFGIVIFAGTLGGASGPLMAGRIFDVTGSYHLAFSILVAVSIMALILSLLLRPTKQRT